MRYKEIFTNDKEFEAVTETATAGASCAGGIATALGGLGAGDPKASIYYDKKKKDDNEQDESVSEDELPIIRRPKVY